ncbi:hypothetical protein BN1723_016567 [Verticillium longisporum]|uniref:Nucleolar complex-associated protein 3 N-terminal domain-containing protein n=1 Tax=Verticillium longisporum TaxID=100787 RepID=A0A0G4NGJ0_VERLO|nr:hypothetical protein BN1723_016567 [Verticillium longisporum]
MSEEPEEHFGAFKKAMAEFATSKIMSIQKLALVTQMAVYKDIIPGYRIRPLAEKQQSEKTSKDVEKLRAMKEQKAIEKDMEQADALVSHEERDKMQSETLKLVFATYFRILKIRVPHLMGATLEGLAKLSRT